MRRPASGDFVGAHGTPTKMTEVEVNQMLHQEEEKPPPRPPRFCIDVERGDRVKIKDGPFENFEGTVEEVIEGRGLVKVMLIIFNRPHAGRPRVLAEVEPQPQTMNRERKKRTMAKVMTAKVKLQCPGGQATPAPPVGPALGQHGVNIGQFVMQFNERTKEMKGTTIPVEITIYSDRTFEFITKSPPAAVLLKQAAGIAAGSAVPNKTKVGTVTQDQVKKIAETKMADLNARDLEHACRVIAGTARSMGVEIK